MDAASKEFLRLYSLLLENRDPEEERRILKNKDAGRAYWYAKFIIKGRWPEAEEFIKKDPQSAYFYALKTIKGRWPAAEEYIKKDPWNAYDYARYVIKGRWPEAEECIKKDPTWWDYYLELICKECNGDGIVDTGIGGADEECPNCNGGGFDPIAIAIKNQKDQI